MDRSVIRRRTQEALQKISEAASVIAARLELGDEASEILNIDHLPKANNDQTIREVYRVESFASLLELISKKVDGRYGTEPGDTGQGSGAVSGDAGSADVTGSGDTGAGNGSGRGDRGVEPGNTGSAAANRIEDIETELTNAGLTRTQIESLKEAGFTTMDSIYDASETELGRVKGIGPYTVGVLRSLSK
jgi:hypothetical protein